MKGYLVLLLFAVLESKSWIINPNSDTIHQEIKKAEKINDKNYASSIEINSKLSALAKYLNLDSDLDFICDGAEVICGNVQCSPIQIYHVSNIINNLGCSNTFTDNDLEDVLDTAQKTSELKNYYASIFTFLFLEKTDQVQSLCAKRFDWMPAQGVTRFHLNHVTHSLIPSKLLWEINEICGNDSELQDKLFGFFLRRITKVGETEFAISAGKSTLTLSAFVMKAILKNPRLKIEPHQFSGLVNFIRLHSNSAQFKESKWLIEVGRLLTKAGYAVPMIKNQNVSKRNNNSQVRWSVNNIFGDIITAAVEFEVNYEDSEKRVQTTNKNKLSFEPVNSTYVFKFDQKVAGYPVKTIHKVSINKKLKFDNVRVAVTKSTKLPTQVSPAYSRRITANQDSKIHILVNIDGDLHDPEYIVVYIKEIADDKERLSAPVPLSFNSKFDALYGLLDLGDSQIAFPTTSSYKLFLLAGDRNLPEPVELEIGSVELSFKHEKSQEEVLDNFALRKKDIIPTPVIEKKASLIINFIFSGIIAVLSLLFLFILQRIGFNFKLFPKSSTKLIYNSGFMVCFALNYLLIFYYWLNERFMDIITPLVIILAISLIVGNLALTGLGKKPKGVTPADPGQKEKDE